MSQNKTVKECFHYRQSHKGANYSRKDFWRPGDPVTKKDQELLNVVNEFYQREGYAPCRGDLSSMVVSDLKARFRTWKNVILAAGLPYWNDAETQKKRKSKTVENIE